MSELSQRSTKDMSARELTIQLGEQLSRLMRDEVALAKAELFASARQSVLSAEKALVTTRNSWIVSTPRVVSAAVTVACPA